MENISCMASVTGVVISAFFPPRLGVLKSLFIASCPGVLGVFLVLLLVGESIGERQDFSTASIGHYTVAGFELFCSLIVPMLCLGLKPTKDTFNCKNDIKFTNFKFHYEFKPILL